MAGEEESKVDEEVNDVVQRWSKVRLIEFLIRMLAEDALVELFDSNSAICNHLGHQDIMNYILGDKSKSVKFKARCMLELGKSKSYKDQEYLQALSSSISR